MKQVDINLEKLQAELKANNIKAYIIPVTDYHMSEYTNEYFLKERLSYSSFEGSDGTLLVTQDASYIYTDGRYWIEAIESLKGTKTQLVKMGAPNVPSMYQFIKYNNLYPFAVDFRLLSFHELEIIKNIYKFTSEEIQDKTFRDLLNLTPMEFSPITQLDSSLLGQTYQEKSQILKDKLKAVSCDSLLLTSLDDIAYLLGFRGSDIKYNPVFYSYLVFNVEGNSILFTDSNDVPSLEGLEIKAYDEIDSYLKKNKTKKFLVDPKKVNAHLISNIKNFEKRDNPTILMKAVKGTIEIENIKKVHELDGVAMLKFINFIEENKKNKLTELEYAEQLKKFRLESKHCYDLSFETIPGFGPNGAMMHYEAREGECAIVDQKQSTFFLVDSGGQYKGGTTDITRTFAFGKPTKEMIKDYTLTLKSVINLSTTLFMKGCAGIALDIKAREIMWKNGMDYKCGTGHGVGYMLNVHEAPNGFRYKIVPERNDSHPLEVGMITTVEPGVYKENKYGIRIENELLCVKSPITTHEQDTFYCFEPVTYCPIDMKAVDKNLLTKEEVDYINNYHKTVYKRLYKHVKKDSKLLSLLERLTQSI